MTLPDHRRLSVYHAALDLAVELDSIAQEIKGRRWTLADQLERSSQSLVLNLAEGAGEYKPRAKGNAYRIARRSLTESMAALDLIERIARPSTPLEPVQKDLQKLLAMVTVLVKSMEAGAKAERGSGSLSRSPSLS